MLNVCLVITWFIAGVSLSALGILLPMGQPFAAKAQEPKRFQHKIVKVFPDTQDVQTKLNEFGAPGGELVTVSMGDMTELRLIFKRNKLADDEA
jgi:hypothetical protein